MFCISHNNTDPYFNIASEEYLLKNFTEDVFMLYRNNPSIIVGKHQNTFAEINYRFVKEKDIAVVRRLSGGGTVFHDLGNLNFTFIRNGSEGSLVDFKRFTEPILQVLQSLGVPATRSGRNDLIIHALKFSGNAEHVYKNRTLHHGTLLFSSKLDSLREALHIYPDHYQDKAVKSVRSQVTNITEHLPSPISLETFRDCILNHIFKTSSDAAQYEFTEIDRLSIQQLVQEKYATWEWNFGYSPRFTLHKTGYFNENTATVTLEIEKGVIQHASISTDNKLANILEEALRFQLYQEDIIRERIAHFTNPQETEAILMLLF